MNVHRRKEIVTDALPSAPLDRFAYSYAVQHEQNLFVSGLVSFNASGEIIGVDDPGRQAEQIYTNLAALLAAADGSVDDLVETTTYLTDADYLLPVNEARVRHLTSEIKPTSTIIVVAGLARPEFLVEISARAVLTS